MYTKKIDPRYLGAIIELLFGEDNLGLSFLEFEQRQRRILTNVYLPVDFVDELELAAVGSAYQRD